MKALPRFYPKPSLPVISYFLLKQFCNFPTPYLCNLPLSCIKLKTAAMRYLILLPLLFVMCRSKAQQPLYPVIENDRWGYIDQKGNIKIATQYYSAGIFNEGLAPVRIEGTFGYINTNGEIVIPAAYDVAYSFRNGVALVYVNGKAFLINTKGEIIFQHPYHHLTVADNQALVIAETYNGEKGLLNMKGKPITPMAYKSIGTFNNGVAVVQGLNDNMVINKTKGYTYERGVIDSTGKTIVPYGKYRTIEDFVNGYARVTLNTSDQEQGYINTKGDLQFIVPGKKWHTPYSNNNFYDGLLVAGIYSVNIDTVTMNTSSRRYDYMGVVNTKGEIVFSNTDWAYLTPFSENRAFAKTSNGDWIMINNKGMQVGVNRYRHILYDMYGNTEELPFGKGLAFVMTDGAWTGIDTSGNVHISREEINNYEYRLLQQGTTVLIQEDVSDRRNGTPYKYGFWNTRLNKVVRPRFDEIAATENPDDLIRVVQDGRMGYINSTGKLVWIQQVADKTESIVPLNIDFMNRGYYYASSPYRKDLAGFGGWGDSKNRSKKGAKSIAGKNQFAIVIDEDKQAIWNEHYHGMPVFVANATTDTIFFDAQDSRLYMNMQAKDKTGVWRDIEYLPSSWCGNSYHTLYLAPNEYWEFSTPQYEGSFETVLRAKLVYKRTKDAKEDAVLYSNEVKGKINPAQFWNKKQYNPSGLMDPYLD